MDSQESTHSLDQSNNNSAKSSGYDIPISHSFVDDTVSQEAGPKTSDAHPGLPEASCSCDSITFPSPQRFGRRDRNDPHVVSIRSGEPVNQYFTRMNRKMVGVDLSADEASSEPRDFCEENLNNIADLISSGNIAQ